MAWVKANGRRIGGGTVRLGSGLGAFAGKVGRFVGLLGFITGLSGDAVYYKELAERAKANGVDMREQGRRESEELRRRGKIWMPGLGAQDDVTIDPKIRKALQGLDTIN